MALGRPKTNKQTNKQTKNQDFMLFVLSHIKDDKKIQTNSQALLRQDALLVPRPAGQVDHVEPPAGDGEAHLRVEEDLLGRAPVAQVAPPLPPRRRRALLLLCRPLAKKAPPEGAVLHPL